MSKSMQCVKTGCHLYSQEYQKSYYGDLFTVGDPSSAGMIYVLKYVLEQYSPIKERLHAIATLIVEDYRGVSGLNKGLLIITDMEMFDYEGQPLTRIKE